MAYPRKETKNKFLHFSKCKLQQCKGYHRTWCCSFCSQVPQYVFKRVGVCVCEYLSVCTRKTAKNIQHTRKLLTAAAGSCCCLALGTYQQPAKLLNIFKLFYCSFEHNAVGNLFIESLLWLGFFPPKNGEKFRKKY